MGKKKKPQTQPPKGTNGWDVLLRIVDLTYSLINSGNIIGAGFLGFIYWLLLISFRMPAEELSPLVQKCFSILQNVQTGYIVLGTALFVSLLANINMYRTYKSEIKRLTKQRQELIHGLKNGWLKEITTHVSCNTDI